MMIIQFFQIKITAKRFWSCLLVLLLGGPLCAGILKDSGYTEDDLSSFEKEISYDKYNKVKDNIKKTDSFSKEYIQVLRALIARAFVDDQMDIVEEIVSILGEKQDSSNNLKNVLQEVWSTQDDEFLYSLFAFFLYRRGERIIKGENQADLIKRDNLLLSSNWQRLVTYITNENLPKPTINAHAFSRLVHFSPDKQLFDTFMQLGEKQHKNDNQYWLNGYGSPNEGNKLTFLTEALGSIFHRNKSNLTDNDSKVKKTLFDKITLDSKKEIYLLEKNNIIRDDRIGLVQTITPSLFAMVCYYNPEDASALLKTIEKQYELDRLKALKEVENQKNDGKTLSLQDRENNINMQAYYIGFLQSKPSIDYLNASLSFEPDDSDMKPVENALMAALNLDKKTPKQAKSLVNKILNFEGIKVGQRHIDYVQNEYKSEKNIQDEILAKLNNLKEKNQEIMKCQDKLKKLDEEIENLKKENLRLKNNQGNQNKDLERLEEEIKKEKKNAQEAKDNLKKYRKAADKGQLADEVKQDIKNKEKKIEELEGQLTDKNKEIMT